MYRLRFNIGNVGGDDFRMKMWDAVMQKLRTLPEDMVEQVHMQEVRGQQFLGSRAGLMSFVEVRAPQHDEAQKGVITIANVLAQVCDVEAYDPDSGILYCLPRGDTLNHF